MSEMIPIRILMGMGGGDSRLGPAHCVDRPGDVNAGGCRGIQAFLGALEGSFSAGGVDLADVLGAIYQHPHFIVEDLVASLWRDESEFAVSEFTEQRGVFRQDAERSVGSGDIDLRGVCLHQKTLGSRNL